MFRSQSCQEVRLIHALSCQNIEKPVVFLLSISGFSCMGVTSIFTDPFKRQLCIFSSSLFKILVVLSFTITSDNLAAHQHANIHTCALFLLEF